MFLKFVLNAESLGKVVAAAAVNDIVIKDSPKRVDKNDVSDIKRGTRDDFFAITLACSDNIPRHHIEDILDASGLFPINANHPSSSSFNIYKDIEKLLEEEKANNIGIKEIANIILPEKPVKIHLFADRHEQMDLVEYRERALEIISRLFKHVLAS